jgi:hypothetical protein
VRTRRCGGALCRRPHRSRCRNRRTHAGVNDPRVLPYRWPQSASTGSFTPALVVSPVAVMRAQHVLGQTRRPQAREHVRVCPEKAVRDLVADRVGPRFQLSRKNVAFGGLVLAPETIASLTLAPCSASSMLFASLRPGRRPGLRALTTPARGTCLALTRWWFV